MSNGTIKDYTPRFNLIIPQFNIATWHDYIEENFRTIDALFYNLFDIQNYKGQWKQLTTYSVKDVVYVGEDYKVDENGDFVLDDEGNKIDSDYTGRLVKVLVEHTTDNSEYFSQYFVKNPTYYEFFVDASTSQLFAQEAKQYAQDAADSATQAEESVTACEACVDNAQVYATNAANSATEAASYVTTASNYATNASTSATNASDSANRAEEAAKSTKGIKTFINQTVNISDWTDNSGSETYVKKYTITLDNSVTADMIPEVNFAETEATGGVYSPICNSVAGGVEIYAKEVPATSFTIPSIIIFTGAE